MHRPLGLFTLLSGLALAGSAQAEIAPPHELALVLVEATGEGRTPAEDVARVRGRAQAQLAEATEDIEGCVRDQAPREEPMSDRERRLVIHMRLAPSGGAARVWVARDSGMPPAVRRCVLEWVRAVEIHPPPRGEVQLRVVFDLA